MAKVPYTKFKCTVNKEEYPVQIGEETIAVKAYLPIQEKLDLISTVIELSHNETSDFSNPVLAKVITDLQIVFHYTNITFTEKQKDDPAKLYDQLYSSGVLTTILSNIKEDEIAEIRRGVADSIEAFYNYRNSVLGILDNVSTNYDNLNFDIDSLKEKLTNKEGLDIIKDVVVKMS